MKEKLTKIIDILLGMTLLIAPLFFLPKGPLQVGMDNYGKFLFFSWLVFLLSSLFLARFWLGGSLTFGRTAIDKPIFFILIAAFLSAVFAPDRLSAFFGGLGAGHLPFFFLFYLVLIFYLLLPYLSGSGRRVLVWRLSFIAAGAITLLAYIVSFHYGAHGLSAFLRLLAGTPEDLSLFLVLFFALLLLISGSSLSSRFLGAGKGRILRIFLQVLVLLLLIEIDFMPSWWLLLFAMTLVAFLRSRRTLAEDLPRPGFRQLYLMPLLISLLALNSLLNFYLVDGPSSLSVRLAENRQATASVSAKVLVSAWLDSPLWGQGLDNFGRSFSLFRPASLNTSPYWDLRLERAFSTLFDWLIATGLIGLLALAFFIYRLAPALFSDFRAKKPDTEVQTLRTLSAFALVLILVVFVFCSANANLFFWAAVFFALYFSEKAQPAVFSGSREPGPLRLKLLAALAALWLFILIQNIYAFKFLLADWSLIEKDPDQKTLERSFRFSPRFEHTLRLAAFHARQAEAARASSQLDQSLAEQDQALNLLEKAEKNGSFSVLAMETVAAIYRDFSEGGDGLNLMAKQAFAKAVALEPSNPVLLNEYGQSLLQARDFSEAKKIFEQTLVAKPDYSPAEFGLAKALAGSGQADEALARLLRLSKEANDADIYYEMGLIYFNEERYPEARKVFESAISLAPLNSNALYGLALALEKTGEKDEALYYFKKVQKINPNNREISEKIKNLEK